LGFKTSQMCLHHPIAIRATARIAFEQLTLWHQSRLSLFWRHDQISRDFAMFERRDGSYCCGLWCRKQWHWQSRRKSRWSLETSMSQRGSWLRRCRWHQRTQRCWTTRKQRITALYSCVAVVVRCPLSLQVLTSFGGMLADVGNPEKAILTLRKAVRIAPNTGFAKFMCDPRIFQCTLVDIAHEVSQSVWLRSIFRTGAPARTKHGIYLLNSR
jgi:hypothetical protein